MTFPIQSKADARCRKPREAVKSAIPTEDAEQAALTFGLHRFGSGWMLCLPYPPSANRYWRHVAGRVLLSAEAREYRKTVEVLAYDLSPAFGEIGINVNIYRPQKSGDLDGRLKQLLDALQGYAYLNDSQIVRINAARFDDKNNPRAEVWITKL